MYNYEYELRKITQQLEQIETIKNSELMEKIKLICEKNRLISERIEYLKTEGFNIQFIGKKLLNHRYCIIKYNSEYVIQITNHEYFNYLIILNNNDLENMDILQNRRNKIRKLMNKNKIKITNNDVV